MHVFQVRLYEYILIYTKQKKNTERLKIKIYKNQKAKFNAYGSSWNVAVAIAVSQSVPTDM